MAKVNLDPHFKELLESLNSAKARFLVLGGYAVIHYGYRRATNDLDIWIAIDPQNTENVAKALQRFGGFSAREMNQSLLRAKGKVFIFGREPVRVDILTSPSGLDFDESYGRRTVVDWDGVSVPLISLEDLRTNKRASGRAKDLADLEHLPASAKRPSVSRRRKK
jgi:predicted nucleotidyltransferase